jgi:hypothetical protein
LEHEILREPVHIPMDGLIEGLCRDVVEFRKVNVQHDAMTPDGENPLVDIFLPKARHRCVGLWFQIPDHAVAMFNYCARFKMSAGRCPLKTAGTRV